MMCYYGLQVICMNLGNVLILGDSYSTFEGWIPEGYHTYYSNAGREETDVNSVEQTWWKLLLGQTNSKLVLNCSYSGSTICHTGYNGDDQSDGRSFICRVDELIADGFFNKNKIDTVFIFGGTNDTWAGAPVGELKYNSWEKSDLYNALPAFCYLLNHITKYAVGARVVVILNGDELKKEMSKGYITACEKYGAEYIGLKDIDRNFGHPTINGMKMIKEQILEVY